MRVIVLGAAGMLGHQLCRQLADRMEIWGTLRGDPRQYASFELLPEKQLIGGVEVRDSARIRELLDSLHPDAVVNAVGIVKQRDEATQAVPSIEINSLFPHQLADVCTQHGIRMIQVSTDCVFSGFRGNYTELDVPDPVDLYGRSKLLGEINRPGVLTLRTSIIGWQLNTFSSLLSWFALQRGKRIKGYCQAIYSGLSTRVLAQLIGDLLQTRSDLTGLYQVASDPISKFDLLVGLAKALGWEDITIEPETQFHCDRSLSGTRFTMATGWRSPSWETMLQMLAKEWPFYASLYQQKP